MIHDKHYKTEKARRQGKNQKNKAQKRNWFTRVRVLFFARRAFAQPHRAARAGPAIARRSPLRAGARQACSTVRGEGSKHPGKPHRTVRGCAMPSLPRAPGRCAPKGPAGPTQATGPPCPPARFALLPFPGRGGTPAAQSPARGRLAARGAKLICLFPGAGPGLFSGCKGRKIHGRKLFEYYRDFVAHKEVYFQNVQAEIECLGDRSCFTEEQAGELLPIFQERLALYDVKRAAAYYLAIRGSFSGTINSFGVKGLDVERFLKLFPPVSARLKDVPLENKNALQLIRERDKKGSLIYADPPYVKTERLYRVAGKLGRFRRFHVRLWQVLTGRDSYVVLSYNDCPFIRKLYQDWYILSFQRSNPLSQKKGSSFGELIITNYDPRPYMTSQMNLFDEPLGEWELKLVHIPNHPPRRKTA